MDEITFNTPVGPLTLEVSETTFRPSTVTRMLAENMTVSPDETVIDVGTGSGVLAILAAKLGSRKVYATDTAPDVVEIGSRNAEKHGVADSIEFLRGDLFDPIPAECGPTSSSATCRAYPTTWRGRAGGSPAGPAAVPAASSFPSGCSAGRSSGYGPRGGSSYRPGRSKTSRR